MSRRVVELFIVSVAAAVVAAVIVDALQRRRAVVAR